MGFQGNFSIVFLFGFLCHSGASQGFFDVFCGLGLGTVRCCVR